MKYKITEFSQVLEGVYRIQASNSETEKLEFDVHEDFFKFFEHPIGSSFELSYENEMPIDLTDVSYMMGAHVIESNIISGHGLLLKRISDTDIKFDTSSDKIYVIIRT